MITINPYVEIDGVRTFFDSVIKGLYARIRAEGKEHIFSDGIITDEDTFLHAMKHLNNHLWIVKYKGEACGIIWINNIEHRTARGHFCMFNNVYGKGAEIGREAIKQVLNIRDANGEQIINTIIGITPASNKLAVRGVKRSGAKIIAVLKKAVKLHDGNMDDGVLSIFTLEVLNG